MEGTLIRDTLAARGARRFTVILSHWHIDHVAGTEPFADCEIIANPRTLAHLTREKAALETGTYAGPPAISPLILPNRIFDDRLVLVTRNSGARTPRKLPLERLPDWPLVLPGVGVRMIPFLLRFAPRSLVLASVAGLFIIDRVPVHMAVEQMLAQTQSFPLIAIPFFMMTGALMVSGKLGQSLVNLLSMMIGRVHGGPAQVGVLSSTIFGGVSGSAVADASAIGSMLIPWLKKLGYPAPFAAGTLAAAATIDILIPPSIPMILFALTANESIAALFYAGMVRRKNVLSTMTQTIAIAAVVTLTWMCAGYSLALRDQRVGHQRSRHRDPGAGGIGMQQQVSQLAPVLIRIHRCFLVLQLRDLLFNAFLLLQ